MKICSLTVTSRTKTHLIADALKSVVDWVDGCVILELDDGADDTIEVAKQIAGDKLHVYTIPFDKDGLDMALWRNTITDIATDLGYDWAVTLDTDERIHLNGLGIRLFLENTKRDVICVTHVAGNYHKERFFRLPAKHRWSWGEVHEYVDIPEAEQFTMNVVRFSEVAKTREAYVEGQKRMLPVLMKQAKADPRNSRWRLYLGYTLSAMGEDNSAISQFKAAAELSEGGTGAWALTLAANIQAEQGDFLISLKTALQAMSLAPYVAEAQCAAAHACLMLGDLFAAQTWAHFAILNGRTKPGGVTRRGYCDPHALYELPFQILEEVFKAEGKPNEAAQARALAVKAEAQRIAFCERGEE